LYSNTAQAHQLGRTRDWVVIYYYDDQHAEGQHTVVTETRETQPGLSAGQSAAAKSADPASVTATTATTTLRPIPAHGTVRSIR